jgi:acetyl-CoA carboxylase biotin carboxyl carrier protein
MEHTLDKLRDLIETLRQGDVGEFEYEDEAIRVRLSFGKVQLIEKAQPAAASAQSTQLGIAVPAAGAADAAQSADIAFVTSPFVGTFYRAASPEAASFVQPGQSIEKGQTLCIVEAMKLMNEIESDAAGTLLEVLAENGSSVEFGQRLFKIRKSKA